VAEVRIAADEHDIDALWDWLRHEPQLQGRISMGTSPAPDGAMGGLVELVVALVTSAGFLAGPLSRWLIERERQRRCDITIKVTGPDGRQVSVSARRMPDSEQVLRAVLEPPPPDTGSTGPALPDAAQDR
jgi:hypothetical protein